MTNANRSALPLAEPWMIHPIDFIPDVHLERFDGPMDEHDMPENPDVWVGWHNWVRAYIEAGERYATGHLSGDLKMARHVLEWLAVATAFRPEPAFSQYRRQAEHLFNQGMYLAWDAAQERADPPTDE